MIETSTQRWWRVPHLWWFTDHTERHSRRVAEYCELLAAARTLPEGMELNVVERFMLAAAAWLHDIGMQAARAPLGDDEALQLRKQHPERSREIIESGGIDTGIQNDAALSYIAQLAQAHGTEYYRPTVDSLPVTRSLYGMPVRLRLLAAILLLADELDLHNERTPTPTTNTEYAPLTAAHWLKHQIISGVRLSEADGLVKLTLEIVRPVNVDDDALAELVEWITTKLRVQFGLVEAEISLGFNGHYEFDRQIEVLIDPIGVPNKLVSSDVESIIRAENARSALINHDSLLKSANSALAEGRSVALVGPLGPSRHDTTGREDVLNCLFEAARAAGTSVGRHWMPEDGVIQTAADVLFAWAIDLNLDVESVQAEAREEETRATLLGALVSYVSEKGVVLLVLSGFDELPKASREWLVGAALRPLVAAGAQLLLTTTAKEDIDGRLVDCDTLDVGSVAEEARVRYLNRYINRRSAAVVARASETYASVKAYALNQRSSGLVI
ncbi:HD domain-containing protein [Agromyces sp. PvR057]|uniref:HD domain-containing protein n=1 Tax=Agromyces sp. PvR057 TaxID=3156403 RepID=UPI003391FFD6